MSQEAPRESGSPAPAQRAERLPYETPPLQILVDPSNPYIDLGTQLGLGENTFFSSRLRPGRLMPTDLGISHHVLDYRMDQMAQEPERLTKQPIPPSLLQRAVETLKRVAPPAIASAEVAAAAGGAAVVVTLADEQTAQANGGKLVTGGAINPTAECVQDDPNAVAVHYVNIPLYGSRRVRVETPRPFVLYNSDPDYARKITSGEILIAGSDGTPIAALEEGDKTAAVVPATPDEAWQNLALPAAPCETKTGPEMFQEIFKDTEYTPTEYSDLIKLSKLIWEGDKDNKIPGHKAELLEMRYPWETSQNISQKDFNQRLKWLKTGSPNPNNPGGKDKNILRIDRAYEAIFFLGLLVSLREQAQAAGNTELDSMISDLANKTLDYFAFDLYPELERSLKLLRSVANEGTVNYIFNLN